MRTLVPNVLVLVLACTALVSCRSSAPHGRLPERMIELYDTMEPAGMIEIEADRNGAILEIEADIPVDHLPAAVRAAARKQLAGAVITGAEIEYRGERPCYEVKMYAAGKDYEFVYNASGGLLETEESLARFETPNEVVDAARAALPEGLIKSFERINRQGEMCYHIKMIYLGVSHKLEISPGGVVKRMVREARVELEVPLQ